MDPLPPARAAQQEVPTVSDVWGSGVAGPSIWVQQIVAHGQLCCVGAKVCLGVGVAPCNTLWLL